MQERLGTAVLLLGQFCVTGNYARRTQREHTFKNTRRTTVTFPTWLLHCSRQPNFFSAPEIFGDFRVVLREKCRGKWYISERCRIASLWSGRGGRGPVAAYQQFGFYPVWVFKCSVFSVCELSNVQCVQCLSFQMSPQIVSLCSWSGRGEAQQHISRLVTLDVFVWLFSTVFSNVASNRRLVTLVIFV